MSGFLQMRGADRARYGCVVTFENAAGKRLVLHRAEKTRGSALRSACDDALALDVSFRVICCSTPESIYIDLVGRENGMTRTPEKIALTKAGRRSMLHPSLV